MRKLWVLLKLNFRAMLRAFSFRSGAGSSKKKAAGGLGALLLMAFLALYLSGVYSFLLASMLAEVGIVEMVLPLMALMACVMSLMFTLFAASGLVFGGKDSDIVLALPVPAFTVMLSKILALYLENLVFCGLWMLPTGAAYLVYAGLGAGQAAGFCVRLLAAALFLPLLPSVLALLGGWVIAYFSGRMKHKSLVGTVLSIVLPGAVLVGSLQINALAAAKHRGRAAHAAYLAAAAGPAAGRPCGQLGRAAGLSAHQPGALPGACLGYEHAVQANPVQPCQPCDAQRLQAA